MDCQSYRAKELGNVEYFTIKIVFNDEKIRYILLCVCLKWNTGIIYDVAIHVDCRTPHIQGDFEEHPFRSFDVLIFY